METVLEARLRPGTLVNWEGIHQNSNAVFFRAMPDDFGSEEYEAELDIRSRDFELVDVAREIGDSHGKRLEASKSDIGDYSDMYYIRTRLQNPFIKLPFITQIHDSIDEFLANPQLPPTIDRGFGVFYGTLSELEKQLYSDRITFLQYDNGVLGAYSELGRSLQGSDTELLRDLHDIFRSQNLRGTPVGDYHAIINSPNVKAKVSSEGFELYPDQDNISIDVGNEMSFSPGGEVMTKCIENSIQRIKAMNLLNGSRKFLSYLVSLASFAREFGLVRPEFNPEGTIDIRGGYHILLRSKRRSRLNGIVTHDTQISPDEKVLAITGPNAGGKSTYIKELGLISVLAQSGSFVPVAYANLPIYTRFLTHFNSEDNILGDISTFQAEIHDMNRVLSRLERGTLLLCDEIFKGTESGRNGGAKLHQGVVEALLLDYPGRTLLSSHYHESLVEQTHIPGIQFRKVDIDSENNPKFTLSKGIDKGGYAVSAAIRAGLSQKVTARLNGNGHSYKKESIL